MPIHYRPEDIRERIARKAPQAAKLAAVSKMKSDLWVQYKRLSEKGAGSEDALKCEGVEHALMDMDIDIDTETEMNFLAGPPSETDSESSKETSEEV